MSHDDVTSTSSMNQPGAAVEVDEIANDPVLSPTVATSQSRSHRRTRLPKISLNDDPDNNLESPSTFSENDPLLGSPGAKAYERRKPFYRPRPLWIVPFAVLASISRGMTIAPRVEVFTQLSCNAVYGRLPHYSDSTEPYNLRRPPASESESSNSQLFNGVENTVTIDSSIRPAIALHTTHKDGSVYFDLSDDVGRDRNGRDKGGDEDSDSDNDGGDDGEDPLRIPSKRCLSDPKVQANAARLQAIMATTVGLCSALTTGFWGHLGERVGRTRVLAASTFGLLLTDVVFVLVSLPHSPLAVHGHKLLILAPAIEGLLGGWSTLQGATSAYVSDCTSDGSRAHIFSRFAGVFYFGFALGPTLGAYLITHPPTFLHPLLRLGEPDSISALDSSFTAPARGRTVTPVFWIAVLFSMANFLQAVFVIPESIGKKTKGMRNLTNQDEEATRPSPLVHDHHQEHDEASRTRLQDDIDPHQDQVLVSKPMADIGGLKGSIFTPLLVFAPVPKRGGNRNKSNNRRAELDWNMTLLGLALFGYLLSSGIFQLKYMYAEHVFGWDAEQLSYYITLVGGVRAVHSLFVIPLVISYCKPKSKMKNNSAPRQAPQVQGSQWVNGGANRQSQTVQTQSLNTPKPRPTRSSLVREMKFDLRIARLSYALDVLSHTLVSLSSTRATAGAQAAFVAFTLLSSFSCGTLPGMQSLALCVMQVRNLEEDAKEDVIDDSGNVNGNEHEHEEGYADGGRRRQGRGGNGIGIVSKDSLPMPSGNAFGCGKRGVLRGEVTVVDTNGISNKNECGKAVPSGSLFGALAVLQATGQMILGPMLFGTVYSTTVGWYPKGIFVLAASILIVSLALLSGFRPRAYSHQHPHDPSSSGTNSCSPGSLSSLYPYHLSRNAAVYANANGTGTKKRSLTGSGKRYSDPGRRYGLHQEAEQPRGRSRVSKDLSGSFIPGLPRAFAYGRFNSDSRTLGRVLLDPIASALGASEAGKALEVDR